MPEPTAASVSDLLTLQEQIDLAESLRLMDEAYQHYFDHSDGHCKSSEGRLSVSFGTTFDRRSDLRVRHVEVYSYVLGSGRQHYFDSTAEALAAVREWHADEMATDYAALEAEEAAYWALRENAKGDTPAAGASWRRAGRRQ